jgi:hypothetical protein
MTATTAFAEPTIEELDMRMRAMENTMQSILELLQEQQASNGALSSAPTDANEDVVAATPVGYQMGALYLDVFTTRVSEDQVKKMRYDPSLLPDGPVGVPSGSALINAAEAFAYGAFTNEAALSSFADADALVSVQWFGSLEITEAGLNRAGFAGG